MADLGRSDWSLAFLMKWISPAIRHEQVCIFYDSYASTNRPVGYVVWAEASSDLILDIKMDGLTSMHESEWFEGNEIVIVDSMVIRPYVVSAATLFLESVLRSTANFHIVYWENERNAKLRSVRRSAVFRWIGRQ